jgi:tetratricopeptide (TPR) repeat protein
MKQRYRHFEYEITDDPDYIFNLFDVPRELQRQFHSLHSDALKGGDRVINRLSKLIAKYPHVPQLKNYLSVAFHNSRMPKKAYEVNRKAVSEHPGYLFAKLNVASEYFNKEQYEKIPEVMGEIMELKALYPLREKFHLGEVTGFYKIAILYFCATGNLEAAEARYNIMDEIAEDHPDTKEVVPYLVKARLEAARLRMEEEEKERISVVPHSPPMRKGPFKAPVFIHQEINWLYENGLRIDPEKLKAILALPRESLISDLNAVVEDSINRYQYFSEIYEKGEWQEETMNFLVHAVFLLGELRASQSLPIVMKTFHQGSEFTDMWYGDFITGELWEPLYHLGNELPDLLREFVLTPGTETYARSLVCNCATQIALRQPRRKQEVSEWFTSLFETLANIPVDANVIDTDFIGLAITYALEIRNSGMLPAIKKLYQKGYVGKGVCGSYDSVSKDMNSPSKPYYRKELMHIADRYKNITTTWAGYTEKETKIGTPVPAPFTSKTGRNDPCPCGSGKKYKKCCL